MSKKYNVSKGRNCSGCKQKVTELDKNGYCRACAAMSLGESIGQIIFETLEKFSMKFMPRWMFKFTMAVVIGLLLYCWVH